MDERSLAHLSHPSPIDHDQEAECRCFSCLEGWVFLGSIDHDGEEIVEAIRCKGCSGTSHIVDR